MALNLADLFEHAADAFGERTAVACGERVVTYRELDERTNRLAHHLAGIGVTAGDHVGLYSGNSIEALETLLACCKLRAAAININYRYAENELRYMFADSDLVALVHQRQFGPRVAAVADVAPGLRGTVVIGDGSDADTDPVLHGVEYEAALAGASPERDFPPRSSDDVYIIYTGGTTGYPKGVMWRHEDIWRTLGGGIDFVTGEPLPDEWAQSRKGLEGALVRLCAAPLIHGNAQVAALAGLFGGETIVLLPKFDAHEIWRAVERHKVNVLVIIGDAMARPLIDALAEVPLRRVAPQRGLVLHGARRALRGFRGIRAAVLDHHQAALAQVRDCVDRRRHHRAEPALVHHSDRIGVGEHVPEFLLAIPVVDVDRRRPELAARDQRLQGLDRVGGVQPHVVARGHAKAGQVVSKSVRPFVELAES